MHHSGYLIAIVITRLLTIIKILSNIFMKIYAVGADVSFSKDLMERLQSIGDLTIVRAENLSENELIERIPDATILIAGPSGIEKISKKVMSSVASLKFISLLSVGYAWVDLQAASDLRIQVSNAKGANSQSVAEHAIGMMLSLSKRITEADRRTRDEGVYAFAEFKGIQLKNKTIGVLGLGDTGKKVAYMAKAFDMRVLGINRSGKAVPGVQILSFEEIYNQADVIVVCLPLNSETEGLVDENAIKQMKSKTILVNTAREQIVDKYAVLTAIKSRKLFGYGVETEIMVPVPQDDPYHHHNNIIVTPHTAFYTTESDAAVDELSIENVEKYLEGNPQNIITK